MSPPPEPELLPEERAAFARGVEQFNAGLYFECHDTLEEVWAGLRGPSRDFFQGLIQVGVGHYHLGRDNREGARSMFSRALKRFEAYGERYFGFDLQAQRAELRAWLAHLEDAAASGAPPGASVPPRWRFEPALD